MVQRTSWAAGLATVLAAGLVVTPFNTVTAQQAVGAIAGKATEEARKPYDRYSVRTRNVDLGQVTATIPLDPKGRFSFTGLDVPGQYLVELYNIEEDAVVCTSGPFQLEPARSALKDVEIDCGKPGGLWIWATVLLAGLTSATAAQEASGSS